METKGYKNLSIDMKCRDFQFEVGKTYEAEGVLRMCDNGFHFHLNPFDLFKYYDFPNSLIAEVTVFGEVKTEGDKSVCSKIRIDKIIEKDSEDYKKLGNMFNNSGWGNSGDRNSGYWNSGYRNSGYRNSGDRNSGDRNSGYWNSGYRNSGYRNSGYRNSGDRNSGDRNSGDWNSGDWNSGFFNSNRPDEIRVFNKLCKRSVWENANKPRFIHFDLNEWVAFENMTEDEKKIWPKAETCGGFLKTISYKDAWKNAYAQASDKDIELLKALPNFDAKVFEEISGVKINEQQT